MDTAAVLKKPANYGKKHRQVSKIRAVVRPVSGQHPDAEEAANVTNTASGVPQTSIKAFRADFCPEVNWGTNQKPLKLR
ncbi:hypothetical protein AB3479_14550 [Rhizobium mongolense]